MTTTTASQALPPGVELMAFTIWQVSRLAGLSVPLLSRWDRTGFFSPQIRVTDESGRRVDFYSFRDLVGLRTIAILRKEHKVSMQALRKLGEWFKGRYQEPWSRLRFYVSGRNVYFDDADTASRRSGKQPLQTAFPFEMAPVAVAMGAAAATLRERVPDDVGRITSRRGVMGGAKVIAGTRVPVSAIWDFHEAGYTSRQIIAQYPELTEEDVQAAIAYEEQRHKRVG